MDRRPIAKNGDLPQDWIGDDGKENRPMTLMREMDAYERMRAVLETEHLGKWAVVCDGELVGVYDAFPDAADEANRRFGKGPYLIRRIGEGPQTLPASVRWPVLA